jgi:hypothetical protein
MLKTIDGSARFWQVLPQDEGANSAFPVVETVAIPVRGIVLIMLAFILLIGPANLIVLSRLKRRAWMLWTIPAISLMTCLLVFLYSFVREGFTPDCRLESVTLLDQVNHRATSVAVSALYCPLTPGDGLHFSADTEITPLVGQVDYHAGSPRELNWNRGQHLRRGWVTARVPAHFQLRKSEARRERLQWTRKEGGFEIINGLGSRLLSLTLADSAGDLYQASEIGAGEMARLAPAATASGRMGGIGPQALFLEAGFAAPAGLLSTNAAAYLMPGTYVAELEQSQFLETGLGEGSGRLKSRSFVYGILDPPDSP